MAEVAIQNDSRHSDKSTRTSGENGKARQKLRKSETRTTSHKVTNGLQMTADNGCAENLHTRPSTGGSIGRKAPPINRTGSASSIRSLTPTKQVILEAVRRKKDYEFVDIDTPPVQCWNPPAIVAEESRSPTADADSNTGTDYREVRPVTAHKSPESSKECSRLPAVLKNCNEKSDEAAESSSDDDGDASSDTSSEPIRAPSELIMEFLDCVMKADYENAQKLCKMILIYEPTNPEALSFKSLIEEKVTLDAEAGGDEEEDEEDSTSEDDTSDSDEDSVDESSSSEDNDRPTTSTRHVADGAGDYKHN